MSKKIDVCLVLRYDVLCLENNDNDNDNDKLAPLLMAVCILEMHHSTDTNLDEHVVFV